MYLGTTTRAVTQHTNRYLPGIGSVPASKGITQQTYCVYRCDRCQQRHEVLDKATETFACGACGAMAVGIHEPEHNVVHPASADQLID